MTEKTKALTVCVAPMRMSKNNSNGQKKTHIKHLTAARKIRKGLAKGGI